MTVAKTKPVNIRLQGNSGHSHYKYTYFGRRKTNVLSFRLVALYRFHSLINRVVVWQIVTRHSGVIAAVNLMSEDSSAMVIDYACSSAK